jgi:hypothetical protein
VFIPVLLVKIFQNKVSESIETLLWTSDQYSDRVRFSMSRQWDSRRRGFHNLSFTKTLMIILISVNIYFPLTAQDESRGVDNTQEADALAKKLADPNATLGVIFNQFDYVRYSDEIENAGQNGIVYSLQPSLPIPLSSSVNLFVRPLIPVYLSQPVLGDDGFSNSTSLGNISADVAVGKSWPSKWMTLIGVFAAFPTATKKQLRSNFTTVGPEIVIGKNTSWGFVGVMVNHAWSVNSSDPDPESFTLLQDTYWTGTAGVQKKASVTAGQYFYTVNLGNAWQIQGTPTFAYNHEAEDGNRFTFPLGTGITKVTQFGKLPVKLNLQYWYYVASPNAFGPQHQIRFQIAPVVPLPW